MFPDLEQLDLKPPAKLEVIERDTEALNFGMPSVPETGALLRTLVRSKPGARVLELGTGTGLATCWLVDGMDGASRLVTVDVDPGVMAIAERHLGDDDRIAFVCEDGADYLLGCADKFDLIFADAWPGKFTHLDDALSRLADTGIYVVDDLLPQESWPENHAPRVPALIAQLRAKPQLDVEYREWSTGILIAVVHERI